MSSSIEENGKKILQAIASQPANRMGDKLLDGKKIQEITKLEPADINDAISILEDTGWVETLKVHGTAPFNFGTVTITPRGKIQCEKQNKQSDNNIEFPSNFTPAMKDMLLSSIQVFESMKDTLVSSLTEAGKKYRLSDGLYYIVLIDLSDSTVASSKMSSTPYRKWIEDFVQIAQDALKAAQRNTSVYIKSIGDGSLFLFLNFDDILDWRQKVNELCADYNEKLKQENKPDFQQYYTKTIVHSGEVYFNEDGDDTQSFAVNIVFKIEKQFHKNELGITEAIKQAIIPEINSGRFEIEEINDYTLDGTKIIIPLWKLSVRPTT